MTNKTNINLDLFNQKFKLFEHCKYDEKKIDIATTDNNLNYIFDSVGGTSYNHGLFMLYDVSSSQHFTQRVETFFTNAKGKITCFGRDWLNRQFAINRDDTSIIYQFDVVYNEVIEIPVDLKLFFEDEIIKYSNELLAESFFNNWQGKVKIDLSCHQCVDYKIPPMLGGKDTIENLEVRDEDVAWEINSQLHNK